MKKTTPKKAVKKGAKVSAKGPEWQLKKLFYTSLKDPKLQADMDAGEAAVDAFAEKYKGKKGWLSDSKILVEALHEYEALLTLSSPAPIYYASFRKEIDAGDKEAEASMNQLEQVFAKRGNKIIFFELELAKISEKKQKEFLASGELSQWNYWLKRLFQTAKHNLTEPEEKILSLLSDVSYSRWIQAVDNLQNTRTIKFGSKAMPLNEAMTNVASLPKAKRRALHKVVMLELKNIADVAESEINAIVARKKITDDLRGFAEPYDATILGYENEPESVLKMIAAVTSRFDIAQRFYKAKAKMLKEKQLTYADRSAAVGAVEKKIPFAEAVKIVREAYRKLHPRYAEIFDRLLANGQVDVYPRLGKTSGAFCSSSVNTPTLVLLNQVDDIRSLTTLAHEMGHAVHSERSKEQSPMYQGYSTVTAETASTFFEQVAFQSLVEKLSAKEQLVALHDRLQDDIATVFRQISCFNFELDMHKQIREKGMLSKEALAALMNEHMGRYLGRAVKLEPEDGYFFVAWSHIRRFFYVYSYAYGQLASRAMFERVKADPSFIETIDREFLSKGGSRSPEAIYEACGLDVRSGKVFEEGLKGIEKDLERLEKAIGKK